MAEDLELMWGEILERGQWATQMWLALQLGRS